MYCPKMVRNIEFTSDTEYSQKRLSLLTFDSNSGGQGEIALTGDDLKISIALS